MPWRRQYEQRKRNKKQEEIILYSVCLLIGIFRKSRGFLVTYSEQGKWSESRGKEDLGKVNEANEHVQKYFSIPSSLVLGGIQHLYELGQTTFRVMPQIPQKRSPQFSHGCGNFSSFFTHVQFLFLSSAHFTEIHRSYLSNQLSGLHILPIHFTPFHFSNLKSSPCSP